MTSKILHNGLHATAAWLDLEGAVKNVEAAALRGDSVGEADARQRAHDLLDTHLDLKAGMAVEVRKLSHK